MHQRRFVFLLICLLGSSVFAKERPKYVYPEPRAHDMSENIAHIGFIYSINVLLYISTQPKTVSENGSFDEYRRNFGRTVLFDNDKEYWNWIVHPYSGSQLYLYYRANSYSPADAFQMAFVSSLLFEYTIEPYTEPASMEDIINTPILGTVLGYFFERVSIKLVNSPVRWQRWIGHIMNPFTLMPFFKEKMAVIPQVNLKHSGGGLAVLWEF